MSQPIRADQNASPEPDPLFAFFAEQGEPSGPSKGDGAASPEKPAGFAQPVERVEAVEPPSQVTDELRLRVDRAERLVERSLIEITSLKSDLATLVTAVEDIKKRQSRRDAPPAPPAQPGKRISPWRAALGAVVLLTLATLAWGLVTIASNDLQEPPPIESESQPAVVPAPIVDAAPPTVEIQNVATVSATPAKMARPRDVVARGDPPSRPAARGTTPYVGTLTIDATPAGEVFVNRQHAGSTPLRLEKLRAGSHLIWIQREGYRRWTRVVPVAADRISHVSATLDPVPR